MRPGRLGPGRQTCWNWKGTVCLSFNEAGAIRPRKVRGPHGASHTRLASMRPGRLGPGRRRAVDDATFSHLASMRPGRLGPGRLGLHQVLTIHGLASMRPGRLGPGRFNTLAMFCDFGSGFNEAGAIRPRKGGRGQPRQAQPALGFNEAGAIRPRKECGCPPADTRF